MKKQFRSFTESRNLINQFGLTSYSQWKNFIKSQDFPQDIPRYPDDAFKNKGWTNWGDFLGTKNIATKNIEFLDFPSARKFVRGLNLKTRIEWDYFRKSSKRPPFIPTNPNRTYKDKGWQHFSDWIGTGKKSKKEKHEQFLSFVQSREFVRTLGLSGEQQWRVYLKSNDKPENIPSDPNAFYKKEWTSWGDWLGTGSLSPTQIHLTYLPFEQARKIVQSLKLPNRDEWRRFSKSPERPKNIPADPEKVYKKQGWDGMGDWLGTGNLSPREIRLSFWSFEQAREFVRGLKLKDQDRWRQYLKSGKKPNYIPSDPRNAYPDKWKGDGDWLGTGTISTKEISQNYLEFGEARKVMRKIAKKYNLKTWEDLEKAAKDGKIPKNIPMKPYRVYSKRRKK